MRTNFRPNFFDPNLPKNDFWIGIGSNLVHAKFAQKFILGSEFQKTNV